MRGCRRPLAQRLLHDPGNHFRRQRRLASRTGGIALQPGDPLHKVALLPPPKTDGLLLPTARMIDIVPLPVADSSTMRDRHTNFCGVFRSATQPSSSARSSAESQMLTLALIPVLSHDTATLGIFC